MVQTRGIEGVHLLDKDTDEPYNGLITINGNVTLDPTDLAKEAQLGEVQASPTTNTVLDRLKTLATIIGAVGATPTALTLQDRLKSILAAFAPLATDAKLDTIITALGPLATDAKLDDIIAALAPLATDAKLDDIVTALALAATAAKQDALAAVIGATDDAAWDGVTADATAISLLKAIALNTTPVAP